MEVSVIIPTYNSEESLKECITALESQSFPRKKCEIIVVDDGSIDGTHLLSSDDRISYIYQDNQGPATARNNGVTVSKGEIILFTDADCVPDHHWVEEMVVPFKDSSVAAVKGAYKSRKTALWARFAQVEFCERYQLLRRKETIDMIDTYSAGYKKKVFENAGGFDTSFPVPNNEDTDLSYRLSLNGHKMVFNPQAFVWHLGHPDSTFRYMRLKFWRGYWRMVVYQRYTSKMFKDSYTPQTLKFQILFSFFFLIGLVLWPFFPVTMLYLISFSLFFFMLLSLSFLRLAFSKDGAIGFLSPLFLFLRSVALGSGALYQILNMLFSKQK